MSATHTEIRAAINAATSGPWTVGSDGMVNAGHGPDGMMRRVVTDTYGDGYAGPATQPADAHLIANAPTWLAELLDSVERLHSWAGLMELLDEHWPADVWPTLEDDLPLDAGHRVVSMMRLLDQARADLAKWQKAVFEKEAARTAAEGQARIAQGDLDAANARIKKVQELADGLAARDPAQGIPGVTTYADKIRAALDSKGGEG